MLPIKKRAVGLSARDVGFLKTTFDNEVVAEVPPDFAELLRAIDAPIAKI
jgi:hypothetical protein